MPSQIVPPPWPWRHRGFVLATAATAAAFVGYHLLERPAPAAPAPVVIAVPTVVPVSAPITAPITVHVPPPPPPPAAPPAPPAPAPHALTPRLDAECLAPGDDPTEHRGRCDWDDGLPAISRDGTTIATLQFPGDGGRGYPSIVVDFVDTSTSRRKTVTLIAPDETDEGTVTPALRAKVARRVASVQRQLDTGDYRALREIPRPAIEGTEPPTSGLSAEIEGDAVRVIAETGVERISDLARELGPGLLVVDSVQTVGSEELDGPPGSVGQVREVALRLMELAKGHGIPVVLVGHVTKDGTLAGPKTLEHLVDVVLSIEGDRSGALRLLRAAKNRFGSTEEVGVFEMGERGLAEVPDPARAFLGEHDGPAPGSVPAPVLEGTRPLMVEVQALVAPTGAPSPRRTASGVDPNRLALLVAVLGRRAGIGLAGHDVYANLAGGLSVAEPGLDLPLALALASSLRDRPLASGTVAIGEVGLLGELRAVGGLERRLREAARLGFTRAVVPRAGGRAPVRVEGIETVVSGSLSEAIRASLADGPAPRHSGG